MSETYMITAKTVEEAIAIANREYADEEHEVSYEIIDMPKKGFLGKTDTAGAGPGASKHLTNTAPSHGGFGAVCQISTTASYKPSMPYDDPEAPELPGSSGRATSFNASWKACG